MLLLVAPCLNCLEAVKKPTPVSYIFFSSRRRHTRSLRDWSSDVCSSDLPTLQPVADTVLRSEPEPGIALLTLNRPERLNAMSNELVSDLHEMLAEIGEDRTVRENGRASCRERVEIAEGHVEEKEKRKEQ